METTGIKEKNCFSSERFTSLVKADIAIYRSNYIKMIIGGTGIFIALALLVSILALIDINSLKQVSELTGRIMDDAIKARQYTYGNSYTAISVWIFCIGLTVLGSLTFNNMSSKRKRISSLMIPASQSEKFALRFIIFLIAGSLTLIIGFLIGLCICQIVFGGGWIAFKELGIFLNREFSGTIIAAFILLALLGNSIYTLGSALWPKLSWIKTWVILMIIQWIGTIMMIIISSADISWYSFFTFWHDHISLLKWTGLSLLIVLNIACWVLSWIRFRNTQIIQRFMTK